ncbi:hypothetical protein KB20921_20210 [Edwardsiella ictaluri]|nr:hypothetical protein KB20921_20210 [Edwardsiella ictaluri]BEI06224.1 hypothetical protein KH201010_20100 [Edwardsiella ictaluri]BEI09683.1 hypothetical protein STU22726_20140 [Edwardsiella ictaluri]BEI13162.1 hypothetical protein STU22816_20150 [Edwardsiella ictaluri]BEI16638.1 hypothetical protein STA22820_20110 [Edwardsiella ictaluri]
MTNGDQIAIAAHGPADRLRHIDVRRLAEKRAGNKYADVILLFRRQHWQNIPQTMQAMKLRLITLIQHLNRRGPCPKARYRSKSHI